MEFSINLPNFLDSLMYLGIGMAGIFVIISIIVSLVYLFRKLFPNTGEEK